MTIRNLEYAFEPRCIALIGQTDQENSLGKTLQQNLKNANYKGQILHIEPQKNKIIQWQQQNSIQKLPAIPDLAILLISDHRVPKTIAELGAKGTRAVVLIDPISAEQKELRQSILDAAKPYNLRIIGPYSYGIVVPRLGLNASISHVTPQPGNLAFVSQSNAVTSVVLDWAAERNIGFSTLISSEEMIDVDIADIIDMLAGDWQTSSILMYLETIANSRKFMSAARAAARIKPVILIKSARYAEALDLTPQSNIPKAAESVLDAAFTRAGLLRVQDLTDLFDAAETLARFKPIENGRLAIISNDHGLNVLAVDKLLDLNGRLADFSESTIQSVKNHILINSSQKNPLNLTHKADPESYAKAVHFILGDKSVDALLIMYSPTAFTSAEATADAVVTALSQAHAKENLPIPVLTNWLGDHSVETARQKFSDAKVATYSTPSDAIQSLNYLTTYSKAQEQLIKTPAALPESFSVHPEEARKAMRQAALEGRAQLNTDEIKTVFHAFDIATSYTHGNKKTSEDDIKDFQTETEIDYRNIHKLIAGIDEDPVFGPIIFFGSGGSNIDFLADSSVGLPPLNLELARDLINKTLVSFILNETENGAKTNLSAVALILVRLSQMTVHLPEILSVNIDPLIVTDKTIIALNSEITINPKLFGTKSPNPRLAIRPYPSEWEKEVTTAAKLKVLLRPIKPEDELLYPEFLEKLEEQDVRLRLLAPRKSFSHEFLARLTQLDYAREMAFAAISPETGKLLGVSRLSADPTYIRAEYAVIVRSDLKGKGLGWELMQHLIAYARAEGFEQLEGSVLTENRNMLNMCKDLGFLISTDADNPGCLHVHMELQDKRNKGL